MNKIIYLFFVLIGMLALVSSTPQGTMVEYGFENWNISANESTNFTMYVYPGSNSIAGMQSSFIYDARYMTVNSVQKGDLISDHGNFSTFFSPGTLTATSVLNTFDAVIGLHNTTQNGTYIILNVTLISGHLTNILPIEVRISDSYGNPISFNISSRDPIVIGFGTISGSVKNA
ncbi:MAG TPA: hypothetical protein VI727_09850 [Candidatus Brocadiaceae bacterium]|nr:hypothetical protein [Candidatus Brocadiaceae bacterium]